MLSPLVFCSGRQHISVHAVHFPHPDLKSSSSTYVQGTKYVDSHRFLAQTWSALSQWSHVVQARPGTHLVGKPSLMHSCTFLLYVLLWILRCIKDWISSVSMFIMSLEGKVIGICAITSQQATPITLPIAMQHAISCRLLIYIYQYDFGGSCKFVETANI